MPSALLFGAGLQHRAELLRVRRPVDGGHQRSVVGADAGLGHDRVRDLDQGVHIRQGMSPDELGEIGMGQHCPVDHGIVAAADRAADVDFHQPETCGLPVQISPAARRAGGASRNIAVT